jgi:hypothetical protein
MGSILFGVFYWVVPLWVQGNLEGLEGNMYRPVMENLIGRRIHWSRYLGVALALICGLFAAFRYFSSDVLGKRGRANVGFLGRFIARLLD